jgi:DNA polymerase III subunit epsilon
MENILIIDTETTGLNPDKGDKIIEIGAALYNVQHKTILQNFSTLLPCETNPVEHINNISAASTKSKIPYKYVLDQLIEMCDYSDAVIAHNVQFDRKFILSIDYLAKFHSKKWICTKDDFKWPFILHRKRLMDICQAAGVMYVEAHRALTDCHFIASCFSKVNDLERRLEMAMSMGNAYV